jgi:LPPG:FO 2-phospho-L-lactate transferase
MNIVVLCGGVGGSKLALGIYEEFPGESVTAIVNTGDDLELFGVHISPDIDTVTYTLAGLVNESSGWGLGDDTFRALGMLERYGHVGWFHLGDADLATHLVRTEMLRNGATMTEVTQFISQRLGVTATVLPMCDEPVRTRVRVADGWLAFQEYFVKRRHADTPFAVEFSGVKDARMSTPVLRALEVADIIVVAPSNPVVSIGPMLAVPGFRESICDARAPVTAVSPFVGSESVTGPADALMRAIGGESTSIGLARHYADWIDRIVIDTSDAPAANDIRDIAVACDVTNTLMRTREDKRHLARFVVEAAW